MKITTNQITGLPFEAHQITARLDALVKTKEILEEYGLDNHTFKNTMGYPVTETRGEYEDVLAAILRILREARNIAKNAS